MNTWNSEFVRAGFNSHAKGFITNIDNQVELQHPMIAAAYRTAVVREDATQKPSEILQQARDYYIANRSSSNFPYNPPTFGYVVKWLSELGKTAELNGLLAYADKHLKPTWDKGGLYYPRNDSATDENGRWTHMDPFSGNAAIGYARLNVENGMKKIWDMPWAKSTLVGRPHVDGLDLSQGVDCLRGVWDESRGALILTVRECAGGQRVVNISFAINNLPAGTWIVYASWRASSVHKVLEGEKIGVKMTINGNEEVDVVVVRDS
jgi:hypothetical protein